MNKVFLILILSWNCVSICAQQKEIYYDWQWKPCDIAEARFWAQLEKRDSVWERNDYYIREKKLQMKGFYKDSACKIRHGYFSYYHSNGMLSSTGKYVDNKKDSTWIDYYENGMVEDSCTYLNDKPVGVRLGWYRNGSMRDSAVYFPDGLTASVSWFSNGNVSSAGYYKNEKQYGKWIYYHSNGKISAEETYDTGRLVSRAYYNEDGLGLTDTTSHDRAAVCSKNWENYISTHIYFPQNVKIINSDSAVVLVRFTITEDGDVKDAYIYSAFHPIFDTMAIDAIRKSPKWIPAIEHNRRVPDSRYEAIVFLQSQD